MPSTFLPPRRLTPLIAAALLLTFSPALSQEPEPDSESVAAAESPTGGGVRERMRPTVQPDSGVADENVTDEQAEALTLTLVSAQSRSIQTWVRTAGTLDETGRILTACVRDANASLVAPGQRVRAFSPDSKSSIFQARVMSAVPHGDCVRVTAELAGPPYVDAPRYVMEIVVERGFFFSIPNEAIIEEGGREVVYWAMHPGYYAPEEIRTGLKGELYSEVVEGLSEGDQVVTFGSFFIDAETKLRSTGGGGGHAHHHH